MHPNRKRICRLCFGLCLACTLYTIFLQLQRGFSEGLLLALFTPVLLVLPDLAQRIFRCRIHFSVYLFALFYAIGPMLGQCWNLYYRTVWWDKLLHISGGVMFALLGHFLFFRLAENTSRRLLAGLFALCFSISIAVLWEFFEFGADQLLGMDMQQDTTLTNLVSYTLGTEMGKTGSLTHIQQVAVDGVPLPLQGYLDIGLIDTMLDMLLESFGALFTVFCLGTVKDPFFAIHPKDG